MQQTTTDHLNLITLTQQGRRETAKSLCRIYFQDENTGLPFELTDGQADIFLIVFLKEHPRNEVIAPTQYGKSNTIAMALILRSQTYAEDFAIITGEMSKSMIIMEKVIIHLFDHPDLYAKLELDPNDSLDRLRRQRSRERLTWKGGGSIRVYTADARNRNRVKAALTGFGSPNIIEDEASLIANDIQAMIMRMLGGHGGGWLLKIGNPWQPNPNHFYRSWYNNRYNRLFIDYHQGLREGRYTQEFIDEMRELPFFDILYECLFPAEDAILEGGYRKIITEQEIIDRYIPKATNIVQHAVGRARLGVDVGRGGNYTTMCLRYDNMAVIIERNRDKDLMAQVGKIVQFMEIYNIDATSVFIDDIGVGGGIVDRLHELSHNVVAVRVGSKPEDERFKNQRAELAWLAGKWIKDGGELVEDNGFMQMCLLNYKEDSSSKLMLEPKSELAKRGVESPDDADSLCLTFPLISSFTASEGFAII